MEQALRPDPCLQLSYDIIIGDAQILLEQRDFLRERSSPPSGKKESCMLPVMSRQATAPGHPPSRIPTAVVIAASDVSGAAVDGSLLQPHRHERRRVAAAGGEADDARAPARPLLQRHGWDGRSERSHESSGSAISPRSTVGWELSLGSDGEKNHNDVA